MKLFGISNCDTVKKARAWLAARDLAAEFHDFKKHGVSEAMLRGWLEQTGRDQLLNRRGTTWRQLPEEARNEIVDDATAVALMLAKPSVIKRPVLEKDGRIHLGFDETTYQEIFGLE